MRVSLPTLALVLCAAGCHTTRESDPARTATEQLLLSTAADRSLDSLSWQIKPGTRCFVVADALEAYEKTYVLAAVRDRLLRAGARYVSTAEGADLIFELRAGALSTDSEKYLIGIPSVPIPLPGIGTITTPELAIFGLARKHGIAKLGYNTRTRSDGALVNSEEPVFGISHRSEWTILLLGFTTQDILPEEAD